MQTWAGGRERQSIISFLSLYPSPMHNAIAPLQGIPLKAQCLAYHYNYIMPKNSTNKKCIFKSQHGCKNSHLSQTCIIDSWLVYIRWTIHVLGLSNVWMSLTWHNSCSTEDLPDTHWKVHVQYTKRKNYYHLYYRNTLPVIMIVIHV